MPLDFGPRTPTGREAAAKEIFENCGERLVGSDVGERPRSAYRSILGFRGPDVRQEKLESVVLIGERIRAIREAKKLSQGDIEKRCGLFRVYISRVENGHLVPSAATLEKLARALEVPLYQLFYEGKERPLPSHLPKRKAADELAWGTTRIEIYVWQKLRGFLARMRESDRRLLLHMARKMPRR